MWTKSTAYLLWCSAIASVVIVATQSAAWSWLSEIWVLASLSIAVLGTVMYEISRRRQKRWEAGDYD